MKAKNNNSKRNFFTLVMFICAFLYAFTLSGGQITNFIDPVSLLFILILSTATLLLSTQWSDYIRAIKIAMGSRNFTSTEYLISENALNLAIKSIYLSGVLGTLIGSIQIATFSSEVNMTIAGMRVAILTLFYAIIINIFHYAFKSKIRKEILLRDADNLKDELLSLSELDRLSSREAEVFDLAMKRFSNKEISDELYIAESTVKKHMQNILKKTECDDRNVMIDKYREK